LLETPGLPSLRFVESDDVLMITIDGCELLGSAGQRMQINTRILNSQFRQYIDGPRSKATWDELTNSVRFNVLGQLFFVPIALILICTLILAWTGIKMLYDIVKSFVTLEVFRDPRSEYQDHPERLRALILSSIITGRHGHGIMLGTLSEDVQTDAPFLARKAAEFGQIYIDEAGNGAGPFFDLLRDDVFHYYRRRTVPASHSEGRNLILFDMEYEIDEVYFSPTAGTWVAAAITINEPSATEKDTNPNDPPEGRIVQIPWNVLAYSVSE